MATELRKYKRPAPGWRNRWLGRLSPEDRAYGLSEDEMTELGTYNGEVWRGIMHTAAWQERMAGLQARFDEAQRAREERWRV